MDIATQAADGHRWTLRLYPADEPAAGLLWIPALGVPAGKYARMALSLASRGITVAVHEWRGNDSSSLRPSRACDWGYRELLTLDIPASFAQARDNARETQWFVGGHSLGGQLAALYLALFPSAASGLVLAATGVPYAGTFRGGQRLAISLFAHLVPLITRVFGYFPGDRLNWAGREAALLMRQWSGTVRTGRYDNLDLSTDAETALKKLAKPALGVRFSNDWLVPAASLDALFGKMGAGNHACEIFDEARLGDRADHFRWMKNPDAVAGVIADWIKRQSLKS
jgi:predicted alpha/beta hydrolase